MRRLLLAALVPALAAAAPALRRTLPPAYDAVVDAAYRGPEGARVDGARRYHTIGAALADAPRDPALTYVVFIHAGRYHEKLSVDRPHVTLIGEDRDHTVITYDAAADTPAPGGGTYGMRGSWTLRITAPDFRAQDLTIENAFDYPANYARAEGDPAKLRNPQGVALMTDGGSDRAVFENCRITGHQDTLFANAGRHWFHRCIITGHVDFIFGAGRAVFEDCDIVSRDRGSRGRNGYVTAASTPLSQPYGFLVIRSRLRKETPSLAPGSVALGRPWHPFADALAVGSVVYVDCWMDDHVGAAAWDSMSSVNAAGTRFWYRPGSARFYEYNSTGPGAVTSPNRRLLSDGDVQAYTIERVLDGWKPEG
ncbi:MAG TPA: pectinesterase family protein [Longimicrobium sp.]|jgi:pectinesterase